MHFSTLIPILPLISLTLASPTPTNKKLSVSVDVFDDNACNLATVRGYEFTKNDVCRQFISREGSVTATSLKGKVQEGCVLQVFADTNCDDVLAAITIDGTCQAPLLGPASSGKLVGC
ncbi:MAG: hypothetical protein Q9169_007309 [Polycauliona sp. 2 TL-2023]